MADMRGRLEAESEPTRRRSEDVVRCLLNKMEETVHAYHSEVSPTGNSLDELIQGTAFFPGGTGLWRGCKPNGPLPDVFPEHSIMFVAHNFGSPADFSSLKASGGNVTLLTWKRLLAVLGTAKVPPTGCFFTNALMGLRPGIATGRMPGAPEYLDQCNQFLICQIEIVRPSHVVALGREAHKRLSKAKCTHLYMRHPSSWNPPFDAEREAVRLCQFTMGAAPPFGEDANPRRQP